MSAADNNIIEDEELSPEFTTKNIFIFTSSGKPIFSKVGNEDDLVTTFGFLQAVISIILATGDVMKCIIAGNRKIVFLLKQSLYFVVISSTNEPESILLKQLEFLYQKLLFILTAKVHTMLENNASIDLRSLLGSDSDRIFRTACAGSLVPVPVALHALPSLCVEKSLREDVFGQLKIAVESSKAAMGLLMYEGHVFAIHTNSTIELPIGTGDAILLTNFITKSTVFKSQDQHWVPICFPGFNAQGYLQAYISSLKVRDAKDGIDSLSMFLVLIAVSNDPDSFKDLIMGKAYMEKALKLPEINTRLIIELTTHTLNGNKIRDQFDGLHFLYKMTPMQRKGGENKIGICQYISSEGKFPLSFSEEMDKLTIEYEKLSLRLRRGSAQWDATLFPVIDSSAGNENRRLSFQELMRGGRKASTAARYSPTFAKGDSILSPENLSAKAETVEFSTAFEDGITVVTALPNPDHSLAFTTYSNGITLIALATYDCELFAAFPSTYGPLEASLQADNLMKYLKNNVTMFLCTR